MFRKGLGAKAKGVRSSAASRRGFITVAVPGGVVPGIGLLVGSQAPRELSRSSRGMGDLTRDGRSARVFKKSEGKAFVKEGKSLGFSQGSRPP